MDGWIASLAPAQCASSLKRSLAEGIRSEQVDEPVDVARATLESSGKLSVVPKRN